ncbi:Hsp20/alpha crystallin family protein [Candidatus Gracilibacteria bacterium]|nr:Hsp20/alpha crystallin family protein [Candidatus Gracilibacteria bacterium]
MSPLFGKSRSDESSKETSQEYSEITISQGNTEGINREEIGQLSLDVLENKESLYILAPLAGIRLEDIDIAIEENTLIIKGERNKPKEFFDYGIEVKNEECFWGKFQRKILLPDNIDFSGIKAIMEYNLLVISLPKIRFSGKNIRIETNKI